MPVDLVRQPDNKFDENAVQVCIKEFMEEYRFIGYIPRGLAARLAPILARGSSYDCEIFRVSKLKWRAAISIKLTTYPVSTIKLKGYISQIPAKRRTLTDNQSPTGKIFRRHTDLIKWSRNFDGISGIYIIWNEDYQVYIGQSSDIGNRWRQHFYHLINRTHHNGSLQHDWTHCGDKYFRFDLLEELPFEELDDMEAYYVTKFNSYVAGYNETPDGRTKCPQPIARPPEIRPDIPGMNIPIHPSIPISPILQVTTPSPVGKTQRGEQRNTVGQRTTKPVIYANRSIRSAINDIFNRSIDDLRKNLKNNLE